MAVLPVRLAYLFRLVYKVFLLDVVFFSLLIAPFLSTWTTTDCLFFNPAIVGPLYIGVGLFDCLYLRKLPVRWLFHLEAHFVKFGL